MKDAFVRMYPFDLSEETAASALDQLQGEIGVTGVSVWAAAPPVAQLNVRGQTPRMDRSRGGFFFHPDEDHYQATRCKPIVSSRARSRDPLMRLGEACAQRNLALRAVVSASRIGRIGRRFPEASSKSVFGDLSHVGLCLIHPDVQALLCGLVADLSSSHPVSGVVVTDFSIVWPDYLVGDITTGTSLSDADQTLLSICFCESCHQNGSAAGVDVAAAQRSVRIMLSASLDAGSTNRRTLDAILADNQPLAAYLRWRSESLNELLTKIMRSCQCDLLIQCPAEPVPSLMSIMETAEPTAGVQLRIDKSDRLPEWTRANPGRKEIGVPAGLTVGEHGTTLVGMLAEAAESGVVGVEFDEYGLLSESALTSIKQAIRFARRTRGGS